MHEARACITQVTGVTTCRHVAYITLCAQVSQDAHLYHQAIYGARERVAMMMAMAMASMVTMIIICGPQSQEYDYYKAMEVI
eukprot:78077-Pyramimonas_sp.AAC.1